MRQPRMLVRVLAGFDHPDWVYELKRDGFKRLPHQGYTDRPVAPRPPSHEVRVLADEIAHRAFEAELCDGEMSDHLW